MSVLQEKKAIVQYVERRAGDPAKLVANADKIYCELGWKAQFGITDIVKSAWNWHKK